MLAMEPLGLTFRLVAVVLPVALYFLLLGLLNSRRRPQLLTGRRDFILLTAALSPLVLMPVAEMLGLSLLHVGLSAIALLAGVALLAPRGRSWVIYNLPPGQIRGILSRSLDSSGLSSKPAGSAFALDAGGLLRISHFPLLRNVTLRLDGASPETAARVEEALTASLGRCRAETSPMAVALLLVATAMMLAPLTLVAQQMPTIVRLITDLVH